MKIKPFHYYMRALHRDIGFFVIGLTIIFALSGIVMIYRDTDFLKHEKLTERQLPPNIQASELGMALHIWNFQVIKTQGDTVYYRNGTYNKTTGVAKYTEKVLPVFLDKLNKLHKVSNRNLIHWASLILGLALLFLAISSFWMFKPQNKSFKRGIILASIGFALALALLFI